MVFIESAYEMKNYFCLFERPFKLQKNSVFLFETSFFALKWCCDQKNNSLFSLDFKSMLTKYQLTQVLRWLITVSSTFLEVDFDASLLPLFITSCYNHGIKILRKYR